MKQTISLHRDDLEMIMRYVDQFNPASDLALGAGYVTINCDSSSGIGSTVDIELPIDLNGVRGTFMINIVDESSW
jgi:hypothetical protein